MPDLGHDVKDQKAFTWPLKNWKKLDKKLTSPEFECGGHKWWGQTRAHCSLTYSPYLFYQADSFISVRKLQCTAQ
jgi:ubiquitin carboxyl-terminal hydrolase 7